MAKSRDINILLYGETRPLPTSKDPFETAASELRQPTNCEVIPQSSAEGLTLLDNEYPFHVAVFDINLKDKNPYTTLEKFSAATKTPIIAQLSELDGDAKRAQLTAMRHGAAMTIIHPYPPGTLLLAAKNLQALFNNQAHSNHCLEYGDLKLDTGSHSVSIGGEKMPFTSAQIDLLTILLSNPDKCFSRQSLFERTHHMDMDISTNTVEVQINKIRKKLPVTYKEALQTQRGHGYIWNTEFLENNAKNSDIATDHASAPAKLEKK